MQTRPLLVLLLHSRGGRTHKGLRFKQCHQVPSTVSRARAKCDQVCRLTLNGFVPVSDSQGKPLPTTSEGERSRRGNRPVQWPRAGVNLAGLSH